jgi:hypothetical protein
MPNPLASALNGLAATCDARGWQLHVGYTPSRSRAKSWWAELGDKADWRVVIPRENGSTMEEAITALWTATQRHCRELAATGPARRAGGA